MRAIRTFFIGVAVFLLSVVQLILTGNPARIIGIAIGLFFAVFGWKIGWTRHRNFTAILGHFAFVAGCLVTAYSLYQLPFLPAPPTILQTLDLPLFWGLFTVGGGFCMITHGYCGCAIKMHERNQKKDAAAREGKRKRVSGTRGINP